MRAPTGGKHNALVREQLKRRVPRLHPLAGRVGFVAMREPLADRLLQIDMQEYTVSVGADQPSRQCQHSRISSADRGFAATSGNLFRVSPAPLALLAA